jgi:hypothetical protein
VEKFFVERDSSWREIRFFVERDSSWREILRGEKRSTERFFKERLSPWREQPRRDDLHGEDISMERLSEERGAPGRTRPSIDSFISLYHSFNWFTSSSSSISHLYNLASMYCSIHFKALI